MSKKMSLLLARGGVAVAAVVASASSFAALDVTAATTAIADSHTPVQTVGMAVFGVLVLVASIQWLRRVL